MPGDTLFISYLGVETLTRILTEADFNQDQVFELIGKRFELDQVVVTNDLRLANKVARVDLETQPVKSSQELLRRVPGLFIGQHAGGGKAEQIFLRGFDIDHGTDIRITVDGLPVNMVSHAHGQGYADLHFLIPETVETLDFGKGPYYTEQGDFNTAGYVEFHTKERLEESSATVEVGQFNNLRTVGLFDLLAGVENHDAYVAGEFLLTDGPFESSQDFSRTNLMAKYTAQLPNSSKLSVSLSHFQSKWNASGQIPERAVRSGMISRFGAIDDTEGGATSRSNAILSHTKALSSQSFVKTHLFYSRYDFELYSNFTFFLEDPENGDQIHQKEQRDLFGFESALLNQFSKGQFDFRTTTGVGLRHDIVDDVELSHTLNRTTTLEHKALGDLDETNAFAYADAVIDIGAFQLNAGVRYDYFKFSYTDALLPSFQTQSETRGVVSPKLSLLYKPGHSVQFYVKSGFGFHSNDARVVVARQGQDILPQAFGTDLGMIWKPAPRILISSAVWYLYLDQEFVYVGDAGIVEPGGETRRFGIDGGLRYQLADWLYFDADLNYTIARSIDEPEGADLIPLAPKFTSTSGLTVKHPSGFAGSIRMRVIGDRPATEDNSIVATGYAVTDLSMNYSWRKLTFGIQIDNLFDTEWNETQFATESRLETEPLSIEEIHFTPGTPFAVRGKLAYHF
jgi:outer membrane receptor protein involved in Fe transport